MGTKKRQVKFAVSDNTDEDKFDRLMDAIRTMQTDLNQIKQQQHHRQDLQMNGFTIEEHKHEHDDDNHMLTPRVPSHSRTNVPLSPMGKIKDLSAGSLLPKPSYSDI